MKYLKSFKEHYNNGYWGNIAGGAILYSRTTKRFLVGFRSVDVMEPNLCWGTFGGKLDVGDDTDIEEAVIREIEEETGYIGSIDLKGGYIFKDVNKDFEYHNFIGLIDEEFEPELNCENDNAKWVTLNELYSLKPKHPGLEKFLRKSKSLFERCSK